MVDDDDDNEREFCERSMMFERAPIPDPRCGKFEELGRRLRIEDA